MSEIINSFNFRWDQPSEQKCESNQDLSFDFNFLCKTSFVTLHIANESQDRVTEGRRVTSHLDLS
jgi:hypothetical protein